MNKYDKVQVNKLTRWQLFFRNIQQDLKLYLFILLVFCVFRIGFIGVLSQYLNEATTKKEILEALYYGMRISLKSAGLITLLAFLFTTLMNVVFARQNLDKIRFYLGCIYIAVLSLLFNARIPFYQDFHIVFNQFIFNTLNDDVVALGYTLVQQYNLFSRLVVVLLLTILFCRSLKMVLATSTYKLPQFGRWYVNFGVRMGTTVLILVFILFTRFGGSLTYANSVHWENATVSKDDFLNEAILDDVQALYRAYCNYQRLQEGTGLAVQAEHMKDYATYIAGRKMDSHNLDDFLRKAAQGAKIEKPKHIFIIVGESYAGWPLMPKYNELNIANGVKGISQHNAAYIPDFLPNGTGTIEAMNGLITGLAEVNLAPNYQPTAYKEPYSTAIAPQLKKLGYKTYLWYGGFSSWQRIKEFALAQGFDEVYTANDMKNQSGNAWGTEDKNFFKEILGTFKADQPSVHVILTTSNHPPYTVDVAKEGFDANSVLAGLPDSLKNNNEVITKLGHFWYADKCISEFVQEVQQKNPQSLFVITGDHADRFNIEPNPSLTERYNIPCVIYGNGVTPELFSRKVAGGQLNIMPTLIEMIAPQGFEYYSIVNSMTKPNELAFNRDLWVTRAAIGNTNFTKTENMAGNLITAPETETNHIKEQITAVQAVSWWMIKHGKNID